MNTPPLLPSWLLILACALLLAGCQGRGAGPVLTKTITTNVTGDSLVLAGTTPARLLKTDVQPETLVVRSTYLPDTPGAIIYEPGRDYVLDAAAGAIARTANSRIPDFATNVLYGQKPFDHSKFPGFGNGPFFVFVDYLAPGPLRLIEPVDAAALLPKTAAKLRAGEAVKVIAYGDSITAGGDASTVDLQYPSRYVAYLRERFPESQITVENTATGGDTTANGVHRLEEKVLTRGPDLVLLAFGMNDHNRPEGGGVEVPQFQANLRDMVTRIRERTGAEVILLSTFPPHPDWYFGTHRMEQYAEATKAVAKELNVAYCDVWSVWQKVLARKDASSVLGNNINHPNDFGHWLYLEALKALRF